MVELGIPKKSCFLFCGFNSFWQENDITSSTAKLKFQDIAKQINNAKKAHCDRIECENYFSKTQLVKELLSFDFLISCHFVTIFRNIQVSTFQDAISPKAIIIELFQKFFHICFYHVKPFQNYLFVFP